MRTFTTFLISLLLLSPLTIAGTKGKISGVVSDKGTGLALPGANVRVVGTTLWAASLGDGGYVILNVPPGVYELRVTLVGYAPMLVKDVRVVADLTTVINAQLEASSVELGEVVVRAERPMVQKDMTATSYVVTSEQMQMLPVKDFVEVLNMQAGVVSEGDVLYVRGGRGNEVSYLLDGMYVNDPVMGGLATRISNVSISELNLLSGTFNAEYGNALSGVVNIVTKEGTRNFAGTLEGRTSEFFVDPYETYRENRVNLSLSGPIIGDDLTFLVTGERDARGTWLPFGYDRTLTGMAKLAVKFRSNFKGVFSWMYSENMNQPYNHSWKYIPDQYLRVRERSRQGIAAFTHSVAPNFFYDLRVSYFNQSYYSGIDKDTSEYNALDDWYYLSDKGTGYEFYGKRDPVELIENATVTVDVKGDLVWQIGKSHEIKSGFEMKKHTLDFLNVYDPKRTYPYVTDFQKEPFEAAAYVQDKIEMNSIIMNLGLRFDYANQLASFRSNPLDPNSVVESTPKMQVSPRIGVAHPISDRTSLHFSYGHFFQNPGYWRLYDNSQYDVNVREPIFGQPDLDAERTTAYEVGVSHQFGQTVAGSFTAYYKDVIGLVGTRYYPPFVDGRYVGYYLYVNESYANIKGFEVRIDLRRTGYLAGALTYTYSVAKGSASSEIENYPGPTESTLLYPLAFDKTHLFNLNANLRLPENAGPNVFGGRPLQNTTWILVARVNSGYPYTPQPHGRAVSYIPKNSARMPTTYSIDVQLNKDWHIGPTVFTAFVEVLNLTNHKNVVYVYPDTGEPDMSFGPPTPSEEYVHDPSNYGPPRRIRLGARFSF